MNTPSDFRDWLSRCGVRPTAARIDVMEILASAARALTAGEILEETKNHGGVNKVTVYRILDEFTRRGILRKLSMDRRAFHYELATEHHPPHPHFQCHTCGEIQCLDPAPMSRVWAEVRGPLGNRAERVEIRVGGVCHKCREPG